MRQSLKFSILLGISLSLLFEVPVQAQVLGYFGPDNTTGVGIKHERFGATYQVVPHDPQGRSPYDQARLWWSDLPWDGNDEPFVQSAQAIIKVARNRTKLLQLTARLHSQANARPQDVLAFYKWMMAAWQLSQKQSRREGEKWLIPVADRAFRLQVPHSYSYARLSFLVMAFTKPAPTLQPLGDRLLRRNPKDENVRLFQVRVVTSKAFDPALRAVAEKEALAHLAVLHKQNPNDPLVDLEEGDTWKYFRSCNDYSVAVAQRASSAYKRYLARAVNAPDRQFLTREVAELDRTVEFNKWYRESVLAVANNKTRPRLPLWFARRSSETQKWYETQIAAEAAKMNHN